MSDPTYEELARLAEDRGGVPMSEPCRLGPIEYDGAQYCYEHGGFADYDLKQHLNCDRKDGDSDV